MLQWVPHRRARVHLSRYTNHFHCRELDHSLETHIYTNDLGKGMNPFPLVFVIKNKFNSFRFVFFHFTRMPMGKA